MTTEPERAAAMWVELVYALPDRYWSQHLALPVGATVADALASATLAQLVGVQAIEPAGMAVFSRPVQLSSVLRDGDRLELLRPLIADAKQDRRSRAIGSGPRRR